MVVDESPGSEQSSAQRFGSLNTVAILFSTSGVADDAMGWWMKRRGRMDPAFRKSFLTVSEVSDRRVRAVAPLSGVDATRRSADRVDHGNRLAPGHRCGPATVLIQQQLQR